MRPQSAKAKGRKAAKEVKALILKLFPELMEDDVIVASSGQTGEDIILSARARGLLPVSFECKNVERLNIWEAIEQAEGNSGNWIPIVAFRRNHSKLYAALELDQLLALCRIYASFVSTEAAKEASDGSDH